MPLWRSFASVGVALVAAVGSAAAHRGGPSGSGGDNAELQRMFEDDQAARKGGAHGIDWAVVKPRDEARLKRTRELYAAGALRTGADWFHAALLLQHGGEAEDYLLAHEMCVAALALGEPRARWLAAAAEDRFLRAIGRPQRFGTQYEAKAGKHQLAAVDGQVTDGLRAALGLPSLDAARESAGRFDRK